MKLRSFLLWFLCFLVLYVILILLTGPYLITWGENQPFTQKNVDRIFIIALIV